MEVMRMELRLLMTMDRFGEKPEKVTTVLPLIKMTMKMVRRMRRSGARASPRRAPQMTLVKLRATRSGAQPKMPVSK